MSLRRRVRCLNPGTLKFIRENIALRLIHAATAVAMLAFPGSLLAQVSKPDALVADGVPPVPEMLAAETRPYMEFRTATFSGWNARDRSMLVATRFANVSQLHMVSKPLGMRRQISFEIEPVSGAWSPAGDTLAVVKDTGGDEFFRFTRSAAAGSRWLRTARAATRLAPGAKRAACSATPQLGAMAPIPTLRRRSAQSSVEPNGRAGQRRRLEHRRFCPGAKTAVVLNYVSVTKADPFLLDVASGNLKSIGDHSKSIAYGGAAFAPNGTLWVTSDENSDVQRLGTLDPATGAFRAATPAGRWDVEAFAISKDGRLLRMSSMTPEAAG